MTFQNDRNGTIDKPYVIFSYGGGVQSNAVLVLAAQGKIAVDAFYFANVGNDSENPATLRYIEEYAKPFAHSAGIALVEVQATFNKKPDTLLASLERQQSVTIPAFVEGGGRYGRNCTSSFKIRVINKHLKRLYPNAYIRVGIGFSTDEWTRARDTNWHDRFTSEKAKKPEMYGFWKQNYYPLLEMGISRNDCHRILVEAGLPVAPKSSCFFCPFHRRGEWITMKREEPEVFDEACRIDSLLAARHQRKQGKRTFIHPDRRPLRDAVPDYAPMFPDEQELDACDIGHCMT